jgi:hypothetical protein
VLLAQGAGHLDGMQAVSQQANQSQETADTSRA